MKLKPGIRINILGHSFTGEIPDNLADYVPEKYLEISQKKPVKKEKTDTDGSEPQTKG